MNLLASRPLFADFFLMDSFNEHILLIGRNPDGMPTFIPLHFCF